MKDKATFAGSFLSLLLLVLEVFTAESIQRCSVTLTLTALHCPQRSTGTAAPLAQEVSAAAPTRAAPGGSGCWVSSSSSCCCLDSCSASLHWVSFTHTRFNRGALIRVKG